VTERRLELQVERLSKSGDGVAQVGGRAVFVAGALPGEKVLAELTDTGKALRAEIVEVLVASPARRVAPCALADTCGGCDWMHVAEATQLEQKQQIVLSALEHLGDVLPGSYVLLPTVASSQPLGYRRRAVLHPVKGALGFFGRRSHTRVKVDTCPALTAPLAALPGKLGALMAGALKDVEEVHLLECEGRVAISVHVAERPKPRHREVLELLVRDGVVDGAVLMPGAGKGGPELFGVPVLEEAGVLHRPDGFAQANAEVNRRLVGQAVDLLDLHGPEAVLELYSGNGNFTFRLSEHAKSVVAVESSAVSVQLAQEAVRRRKIEGVRLVQGDCEKFADGLVREGQRFDRLLLDPPRTGAPGVGAWASRLLVKRVVYVACDPASLARDAAELVAAGFAPVALQLFDLFPQTRHIEAVMAFAR
jgi:23S rRNA (uracil1939-C5)-methyltransferase